MILNYMLNRYQYNRKYIIDELLHVIKLIASAVG